MPVDNLDAFPAAVLGSSGGAVITLALIEACPEAVHTVFAPDPPPEELLDDRDRLTIERAGTGSSRTAPFTTRLRAVLDAG